MTHINRKIIITIDGEKGQSGKTTVEITENGKPKTRFEWTEATFTSLTLMEIATDILGACHEDMMKHWMKYNHVPDAGEMVEQDHIADASKMMEQPIPDSTQLIAEWEKEKAVLEQKDFRGDAERMAYNAFLDGFVKGLGYEGTK